MIEAKSIDEFSIGQNYTSQRLISDKDVRTFAELSGDKNPIHLDDAYAQGTHFKKRVVHGAFLGACLSKVLGMDFPGQAAIYLSQELRFLKPVFVGDTIEIKLKIVQLDTDKRIIELSNEIKNLSQNYTAAEGHSKIKWPRT
jgi:3-hydroxybutyryl-CoA dehydratase